MKYSPWFWVLLFSVNYGKGQKDLAKDEQWIQDSDEEHLFEENPLLFEGDIILNAEDEEKLILKNDETINKISRARRNSQTHYRHLWPSGVLPYRFKDDWPEWARKRVTEALAALEAKVNSDGYCIKPLYITKNESYMDHIALYYNVGCCSSMLGYQRIYSNGQPMNLMEGCLQSPGVTQHEFMHALGIQHEHARMDRDNYITVVKENIWGNLFEINFKKYNGETFGLDYDYGSLMHYSAKAFSKDNKKLTIVTKNGESIGQRLGPSDLDIQKIRHLYGCTSNMEHDTSETIDISGMREISLAEGEPRAGSCAGKLVRDENGKWTTCGPKYAPVNGFRRQRNGEKPWMSGGWRLPNRLWIRLPEAKTVARFGFRNQREYQHDMWGHTTREHDPKSFKFIGSPDCVGDNHWFRNYSMIMKVDDVKWSKGDEFHYWDIALEKQRRFRCFGFEFLSVHKTRSWGSWVAVQDVKFWETDDPTEVEWQQIMKEEEEEKEEKEEREDERSLANDLQRIRLVDQNGVDNYQSGRLEIFSDGEWVAVCDDNGNDQLWNQEMHLNHHLSQVVCRMHGYTGVGVVLDSWAKRTGIEPNWKLGFTQLTCEGNELSVFDCKFERNLGKFWKDGALCQPEEALGIYCF